MATSAVARDDYVPERSLFNDQFDTNNKYQRGTVLGKVRIDRIFGTPGVAMHYWGQAVH